MVPVMAPVTDYLAGLRNLPLIAPEALLDGRHLLVIAPHPDDESLGVGGLIAAAAEGGSPVTVAFLTAGEASHRGSPTYPAPALAALRRDEARAAIAALGLDVSAAVFYGLPDGRIARSPPAQRHGVQDDLAAIIRHRGDTVVCVTAASDPHRDHRAAFLIARRLCRRTGAALLSYPIWTWMQEADDLPEEPAKGWRVDIRAQRARKSRAIQAHRSQHGGLITDAAESFALPEGFLACFDTDHEVLIAHDTL
jgi:LmbE family N-acetylglucosaminyl deacetylase